MNEPGAPGLGPGDNDEFADYLGNLPPIPVNRVMHSRPVDPNERMLQKARNIIDVLPGSEFIRSQALFPIELAPRKVNQDDFKGYWQGRLQLPASELTVTPLDAVAYFAQIQSKQAECDWPAHAQQVTRSDGMIQPWKAAQQPVDPDLVKRASEFGPRRLGGLVIQLDLLTWRHRPDGVAAFERRRFQVPATLLSYELDRLTPERFRTHLGTLDPNLPLRDQAVAEDLDRLSSMLRPVLSEYVTREAYRHRTQAMERRLENGYPSVSQHDQRQTLGRIHRAIQDNGIEVIKANNPVQ